LNYSEFFQNFYLSRKEGGLVGYKSQTKIPEFFFKNALKEDYQEVLPYSDDAYARWFKGSRNPDGNVWAAVNSHFDDDRMLKELLVALNEAKIRDIMHKFSIELPADEAPNKRQFAIAIKEQFHALANGNGSADNIVPETYKKSPEPVGFTTYLHGAINNYKYVKLPGGDECLLSDIFVCNGIGTSAAVFPHRIKGNYIENATLEKLRSFDRRGEVRRVILIGGCGYGKTLMLQHLFLEAAKQADETSRLPVLAQLRNYLTRNEDLLAFLVDTVQEYDPSFTEEIAVDMLSKGQAQILLDGLDELDPGEVKTFQRKLAAFAHRFPDAQIIVASRQCSAIKGISGFVHLYLHPLDEDQVNELLDKLLLRTQDADAKETVQSLFDLTTGYLRRDGFIATNPMLLTVIISNCEKIKNLNGDKTTLYEMLYDVLIRGHDEEKEAFERIFHSVGSSEEFTQVFRAFCALAYMDGVFEFDHRTFEKYFKDVKKQETLSNPNIFQLDGFEHDVCATACMMYEQESGIYYIDPGFQDYFFAEYYYFEDTEKTKAMGEVLRHRKVNSFRNLDGLRMLYKMSPTKTEVCLFLPFLKDIFKNAEEDETFLRFLSYGYKECTYTEINDPAVKTYMHETGADKFDCILDTNSPRNILMALILDLLDQNNSFVLGASVDPIKREKNATKFLSGFLQAYVSQEDRKQHIVIKTIENEIQEIDPKKGLEYKSPIAKLIRDEKGEIVCFGYKYKVDPLSLLSNVNRAKNFIVMAKEAGMLEVYKKVKDYFEKIVETQKENDFR
jgi:23S rRNA maturation mini-RNase III